MSFIKSFIGNSTALTILNRQLETHSVNGSYFFVGPKHIGKATVAKAFAVAIAGSQHGVTILGSDDDTESISIEAVRDLKKTLRLSTTGTEARVIIIENVAKLSESAANSLLKLIEEPPRQTFFILVGQSTDQVPQTITSRCHVVYFQHVSLEDLKQAPRPKNSMAATAHEMALAAGGRPGLYLTWLDDGEKFSDYKELVKAIAQSLQEKNVEASSHVSRWFGASSFERDVAHHALESMVDDRLRIAYGFAGLHHPFAAHQLKQLGNPQSLVRSGERLIDFKRNLRANVNAQTAFENYILQSI